MFHAPTSPPRLPDRGPRPLWWLPLQVEATTRRGWRLGDARGLRCGMTGIQPPRNGTFSVPTHEEFHLASVPCLPCFPCGPCFGPLPVVQVPLASTTARVERGWRWRVPATRETPYGVLVITKTSIRIIYVVSAYRFRLPYTSFPPARAMRH